MVNHNLKIHLGCGEKIKKGYINIDVKDSGQEIIRDIEKGLPFCDNSCIEILAEHLFEHLDDLEFIFNECWRVLKPRGILKVIVPHKDKNRTYWILHRHYFTEETFRILVEHYPWKITELVTNKRLDIYCSLTPIKK